MNTSSSQALAASLNERYCDDISSELLSIAPLLEQLIRSSEISGIDADTNNATKVYRTVLTSKNFSNSPGTANEAVALAIAQLNCYRARQHTTILELSASALALSCFISQSKGNIQQLLSLFKSADLLIIEADLLALTIEAVPNNDNSLISNQNIIQQHKLNNLLIKQADDNSHFYLSSAFSDDSQALLTQRAVLPTNQSITRLDEQAITSALAASFMMLGKRYCDATVLALATINQLQDNHSIKDVTKSVLYLTWPCDLSNYPRYNGAINNTPEQQGKSSALNFASTKTLSLGLYPVIDNIEWLERLLAIGVETIQLRIKDMPLAQLDSSVAKAAELGKQYNARLFINDYWQLAIKHQCYGVHLGQEDLDSTDLRAIERAGLRLGISTHSEYEWLRAASINPSYIAMGTVYPTQTKPAILIGLNNLNHWCKTLAEHFPIVAIGGIKEHNIDDVLKSGAGSIAVVTAITEADDYRQATARLAAKQQTQHAINS
jgi:thiamine-phosphate diphosphorylase